MKFLLVFLVEGDAVHVETKHKMAVTLLESLHSVRAIINGVAKEEIGRSR